MPVCDLKLTAGAQEAHHAYIITRTVTGLPHPAVVICNVNKNRSVNAAIIDHIRTAGMTVSLRGLVTFQITPLTDTVSPADFGNHGVKFTYTAY